jgi:23S rRNA (guanosine2251-2'-O)-methyltransferase
LPKKHRITSQAKKRKNFNIYGLSSGLEFLRFSPEKVAKITIPSSSEESFLKTLLSEEIEVDPSIIELDDLAREAEFSLVLNASTEDQLLEAVERDKPPLVVALDHISDPRNLGAIVRTAAFFGIQHVVVPARRQVLMTEIAVQTAQGGFAVVDLTVVSNLGRVLNQLKGLGFWVVGTAMDGEPVEDLKGFYDHTCLVLGNEGEGLAHGIRAKCDRIAAITSHATRKIDSLNVSVAAGISIASLIK